MNVPGKKIFAGESFYTDWFARGGDGAILRGQAIDEFKAPATTGVTVLVEVFTKNTEETGDGAAVSGFSISLDGTNSPLDKVIEDLFEPAGSGAGIEEMVRLKVSTSAGSDGNWLMVRTFPFVWFEGAQ